MISSNEQTKRSGGLMYSLIIIVCNQFFNPVVHCVETHAHLSLLRVKKYIPVNLAIIAKNASVVPSRTCLHLS